VGKTISTESSEPRVSFILATLGDIKKLTSTLDQVRDLKTPEDELIVVVGDPSFDPCLLSKETRDRVDRFIIESDEGPAHAVNKGIIGSSGRYIRQITDDDITDPDAMSRVVDVLDQNKHVDLLVCGGTKDISGNKIPVWVKDGTNYGSSVVDPLTYGASGSGFVLRRSSLALIGLYGNRLTSDAEIVMKAIKVGGCAKFCRIHLFTHSINESSHVMRDPAAFRRDVRNLGREYMGSAGFLKWQVSRHMTSRHTLVGKSYRLLRRLLHSGRRKVMRRPYDPSNSYPTTELLDSDSRHWDGGFS
jgi:glycosyltransferase involved in cell wall biosynthesis